MVFRHRSGAEKTDTRSARLHGTRDRFFHFGRKQAVALGILDRSLVAPVAADEQAAVHRDLLRTHALDLFAGNLSDPGSRLQIEIIVIHREESVDRPVVP